MCLISLALKEAGCFLSLLYNACISSHYRGVSWCSHHCPGCRRAVTSVHADPGTVGPGISVPMGIPVFGQFSHMSLWCSSEGSAGALLVHRHGKGWGKAGIAAVPSNARS